MKEKIIGTGLSGLVGSRIVELLGGHYDFVDISLETGVDILDPKSIEPIFDANRDALAVLHLAAFTDTGAAWQQRGDKTGLCYRLNVEGTRNVVDLCRKHGFYMIYISTDFIFDGKKEGAYTEEDEPHPIEWYGETKFLGEQEVPQSGIPAVIARIAFPFRAGFEAKQDIVRKTLAAIHSGTLYPMFADQVTTPTFIDDIAGAMQVLIEKKPEGIFHIVGSGSQSPYEMARQIAEVFGYDPDQVRGGSMEEYLKSQPPDSRPWQKNLALSNEKACQEVGVTMRTLREALLEMKRQIQP